MTNLKAGAGKRVVDIPQKYLSVENFCVVHDPIHARAVAVRQEGDRADEETILLVSLELTSMPDKELADIRRRAAEETGIKEEKIWICVTHSFSSPHLLPEHLYKSEEELALREEYFRALQKAVVEAAKDAVETLRPALLGINTGICNIVANRDIELEDGWWVGTNGDGPTNRTVTVLRFNDPDGKPIALISHFALQSSVMDQSELTDGGKPVTSDIAGHACLKIEKESENALVAMFLIGAAGDQAPIEKAVSETFVNGEKIRTDLHEQGFEICERLSGELKERICKIAHEAVCDQENAQICTISETLKVPAKHMNRDLHSLRPTRNAIYEPDGESETGIEGIRIGSIALLGVKPELTCCTAADIMEQSAFDTTLICTLVNGASKYMADAGAYDRSCYEAQNSPFGRGAAEMLTAKAVEMLKKLKS